MATKTVKIEDLASGDVFRLSESSDKMRVVELVGVEHATWYIIDDNADNYSLLELTKIDPSRVVLVEFLALGDLRPGQKFYFKKEYPNSIKAAVCTKLLLQGYPHNTLSWFYREKEPLAILSTAHDLVVELVDD
jgi:hypothetical protein